jgi:nucleotide-binding universal stress UspA family protein
VLFVVEIPALYGLAGDADDSDVVVMGTRGRTDTDRYLLGRSPRASCGCPTCPSRRFDETEE